MLRAQALSAVRGGDPLFQNVSLTVRRGDRVALVGPNGAGKTTILSFLSGEQEPDGGRVTLDDGSTLIFLHQEERAGTGTVWEEVTRGIGPILALEREMEELAGRLEDPDAFDRWAAVEEEFGRIGGYDYRHRVEEALGGLGLPEETWQRPARELSGGQQTRVALARALVARPDFLLLDEPTNHLDADAVVWLTDHLGRSRSGVVIVSHDAAFLEATTTSTAVLDEGTLRVYPAPYQQAMALRQAEKERLAALAASAAERRAADEAFIQRFRQGSRAAQAKSRERRLARRLEQEAPLLERAEADRRASPVAIRLGAGAGGGELLVQTGPLIVGYGETPVLRTPPLVLGRGQKVVVAGPNGSGKSTLLKTLAGELKPIKGLVRWDERTRAAYYAQGHEGLDRELTVLETVVAGRGLDHTRVRALLGRFGFTADDINTPVGALSGGEKSRLALARLALAEANLLLLDEPTNHLDPQTRAVLLDVLTHFGGTIVVTSHDEELLERLGATTWTIADGLLSADGRVPRDEDVTDPELLRWGVAAGTPPPPPPAAPVAQDPAAVARREATARAGASRGDGAGEKQRGKGRLHSTTGMAVLSAPRPVTADGADGAGKKRKKKISRDRSTEGRR
jgi:ATP-binding cassette, subfamily F, member 3